MIEDTQGFQLIMSFLIMPIFFLSGALFPMESMPRAVEAISSINPLTYGVDGLRGVLINGAHYTLISNFTILIVIATTMMIIGAYLFSRMQA